MLRHPHPHLLLEVERRRRQHEQRAAAARIVCLHMGVRCYVMLWFVTSWGYVTSHEKLATSWLLEMKHVRERVQSREEIRMNIMITFILSTHRQLMQKLLVLQCNLLSQVLLLATMQEHPLCSYFATFHESGPLCVIAFNRTKIQRLCLHDESLEYRLQQYIIRRWKGKLLNYGHCISNISYIALRDELLL